MKLNVGPLESFVRIFVGTSLTYAVLHGDIEAWGYLGIVLLATGLSRFSPTKCIFGIKGNDCETEAHH